MSDWNVLRELKNAQYLETAVRKTSGGVISGGFVDGKSQDTGVAY